MLVGRGKGGGLWHRSEEREDLKRFRENSRCWQGEGMTMKRMKGQSSTENVFLSHLLWSEDDERGDTSRM